MRTGGSAGAARTATIPPAVAVAGVEFEPVTREQAARLVVELAADGGAALVVTPNVDHAVLLQRDARFRAAYDRAWLRLCDGAPLLALSRMCGHQVPERVTGSDLLGDVCGRSADEGLKIFIAGGAPAVLSEAVARLRLRFPTLRITGHSPPWHFEGTAAEDELQLRLAEERPDIVMVCFGAPRSEIWAARQQECHPAVYLCVGAAVDYAAGAQRRAPGWVQRVGMEWFYRLLQEPRRLWRRYLVRDSAFIWLALQQLCRTYVWSDTSTDVTS